MAVHTIQSEAIYTGDSSHHPLCVVAVLYCLDKTPDAINVKGGMLGLG